MPVLLDALSVGVQVGDTGPDLLLPGCVRKSENAEVTESDCRVGLVGPEHPFHDLLLLRLGQESALTDVFDAVVLVMDGHGQPNWVQALCGVHLFVINAIWVHGDGHLKVEVKDPASDQADGLGIAARVRQKLRYTIVFYPIFIRF
jgi:hypothetical protein